MKKTQIALNIFSGSRAILAIPVAFLAMHGKWGTAFALLVFSGLTDAIDGWLARRLNLGSKFGQLVMEPFADFSMCAGAVAGLWLSGIIGLDKIIYLSLLSCIFMAMNVIGNLRGWPKLIKMNWPAFYYLGILFSIFQAYAYKSLGESYLLFLAASSLFFMLMAYIKRARIADWIEGKP